MEEILTTPNWKIKEVFSHQEAIEHGRNEWCTAREGNYYSSRYTTDKGRLFIFCKLDKVRPQYQLFRRHSDGSTEFCNGGNRPADLRAFAQEESELTEWITNEILNRTNAAATVGSFFGGIRLNGTTVTVSREGLVTGLQEPSGIQGPVGIRGLNVGSGISTANNSLTDYSSGAVSANTTQLNGLRDAVNARMDTIDRTISALESSLHASLSNLTSALNRESTDRVVQNSIVLTELTNLRLRLTELEAKLARNSYQGLIGGFEELPTEGVRLGDMYEDAGGLIMYECSGHTNGVPQWTSHYKQG